MTHRFHNRELSRRRFLQAGAAGLGTVVAWQLIDARPARAAVPASGPAAVPIAFGTDWLFGPSVTGGTAADFDDSGLATVTLPHTVTPLSWREWDPASWERTWLYRRHFDAPPGSDGMRVFVEFHAALTGTALTLNGHDLPRHVGGYLPFTAELTGLLRPTGNVLAVVLDSGFNFDVPPDRPAPQLARSVDFWQPGGIYRDVELRVVPQVFIADVFAKPINVLDAMRRQVEVEFTLDAAVVPQGELTVTIDLRDGARTLASVTVPVSITATGQLTGTATLTDLSDITLWDVDDPHLYDVIATLSVAHTAIHDYRTRIGFREASFQLNGFYLNGRRVQLFGVNRHQHFPFVGCAMPARVQRKDAEILRSDLNCNMVRCSHYPQSEAFLDACDELGLLVWEEMPGWGYFGDAAWAAAGYQDIHDMIVRDRNHPSIIVWGAMPNEAGSHLADYTAYHELAHSLDDSRPTGGDNTAGDTAGYVFDVFSSHDYSHQIGPLGRQEPSLKAPADAAGKPYLVCEAVGTLSGPATYYRRIDAQWVQQGQGTAHARVHSIAASDDRYCGLLAWSGYDYPSHSGPNVFQEIKFTGIVDVFRIIKPGAAIYQAQVDPGVRPVIAPAFYWDFGPTSPINQLGPAMICANLDRLEVYVAGAHFATATPDTTNYGHLTYPPSFIDFSGVDGRSLPELRIDGYLGATKVASHSFSADAAGDRLLVTIDDTELIGDGSDATRIAFRAVDRYGRPRPYVPGEVTLSINGPAVLIGDNPFAFADAGSAGAVWVRTIRDTPGTVTLTARHPTLGSAAVTARISPPTPGGTPAPYGTLRASASRLLATPGAPTTLDVTFTNNGLPELNSLTLSLQLPAGWSTRATTGTSFSGVKSGHQVVAAWQVTPPADAEPADYEVTITATYPAHGERGVSATTATFAVPYPSLAAAFNNAGISDDSDVFAADFDGLGDSYSLQALADAGLAPATVFGYDGISLTWPDMPPGMLDNVVAQAQTLLVPGSGRRLAIVGTGSTGGAGGLGTVYYADGTTSAYTVTLDNFLNPPITANDILAEMPYINDSNAASNGGVAGRRDQTAYVFATSVDITAGKQVVAITLPAGGVNPSSGRVVGMHVFALGVG
ncbi:MAG TPA: glycoside hydrolase family 2 TIM barrel-domain containing protein [Jatrophihabitantaceae bacterium]